MKILTPGELVIKEFGGYKKAAQLLGRDQSSVFRWGQKKGRIPSSMHIKIINVSKELGLTITPDDLIFGRVTI